MPSISHQNETNVFVEKIKSGRLRPLFTKEASWKESLREGDARCHSDLRRNTRKEEVSQLGRGLKSLKFYGLFYLSQI
jgi:hypothetical protein